MSFTCEEVWQFLPKVQHRLASVHLSTFPSAEEILGGPVVPEDPSQTEGWTALHGVRNEVLKKLEEARNAKLIGGGLEAQVRLQAADPLFSILARHQEQLRYLFIVSAVTLEPSASGNGAAGLSVQVEKAEGQKCERCWNYSTHVGEDHAYPTVCERCSAVLKQIESN